MLVYSKHVWKFLDVVVKKRKLAEILEVGNQSNWEDLHFVATEVKHFETLVGFSTELLNACDPIHVQVQLLKTWHQTENMRDLGQLVAIKADIRQTWPIDDALVKVLVVEEALK